MRATTGLWICQDCCFAVEYGLDDDNDARSTYWSEDEEQDYRERFIKGMDRLVPNFGHVANSVWEHDDDCEGDDYCECGLINFSRGSCDICDSHLAGYRYQAIVIEL